ncbi:MAG: hypothetical protein ACLQGP_25660 [Isosphaeraceae bacterium]
MIAKILELITGKDDLERVAYREDLGQLNAYLKTRRVLIPKRPRRFLDADTFTQEELLELMREEAEELSADSFEPWILEVDGKKRLPAFSSQKKMTIFSGKLSQQLNKVFSLGCAEVLLWEIATRIDIDCVELNLFSRKSWEIGIDARPRGG